MSEFRNKTNAFFQNVSEGTSSAIGSLPTFERSLDKWFDQYGESIIEEWGLITDDDLRKIELKFDYVSYEVNRLMVEKNTISDRVSRLEKEIEELERAV